MQSHSFIHLFIHLNRSLGEKPHLDLTKMALKYGDVFSLMLGNRLLVVLNGVDAIQKAMVKHSKAFAGRPHHIFKLANPEGNSLLASSASLRSKTLQRILMSWKRNCFRNLDEWSPALCCRKINLLMLL